MYQSVISFLKKWRIWIELVCIIALFILVATYQLNSIPSDFYGDISIVNNYVSSILSGDWPFTFVTSAGPLYFYIIFPFVFLLGKSYLTYKIISVGIATVGLIFIYLFSKEFSSKTTALLTTMLTGFSFWYIVWSRLGNFNIISPILTACMMYFFIKYTEKKRKKWLFLSAVTSSLGLITYPGIFLLPGILFLLILYDSYIKRSVSDYKSALIFFIGLLPGLLLFIFIFFHSPDSFSSNGFLGTKLVNNTKLPLHEFISRLLNNTYRTLTMLHIEGDIVFRVNIPKAPFLDRISGIFFIIGFVWMFFKRKKYLPYLLIPLIILPIPSLLPGHPSIEIPNSARTMAIIPFVFLFVAYGVQYSWQKIQSVIDARVGYIFLITILSSILYLNFYKYFVLYPQNLPNDNVSFGVVIAKYMDSLSPATPIYIPTLGWGDWGQPTYDSIYYSLMKKDRNIILNMWPSCSADISNFVVITDPANTAEITNLQRCFPSVKILMHSEEKQKVFISVVYKKS